MDSADSQCITLDARELAAPDPFIQAMERLQALQPGQYLHMIHRRAPRLLYPELEPRGLQAHTIEQSPSLFHIIVWPAGDALAHSAAQQQILALENGDCR